MTMKAILPTDEEWDLVMRRESASCEEGIPPLPYTGEGKLKGVELT